MRIIEGEMPNLLAHSKVTYHCIGLLGYLLKVAKSAGGDGSVYNLLCSAASHCGSHLLHHLLCGVELLLLRYVPGCSKGIASWDYCNLKQRVGIWQQPAYCCVTGFVEGYGALLLRGYYFAAFLQAAHNSVYGIHKVRFLHALFVLACRYEGSLVADICYICSGEARSLLCKHLFIQVFGEFEPLEVHFKYLLPLFKLRKVHIYLTVESAGSHKSLVQNVCPVCCRKADYSGVGAKAIHLCKELVEGILPLVVGAEAHVLASGAANCIYLIYEDNARGLLLCLLEEVAYPGGAHSHKHLHKVGAGDGEEWNICLSCHRFGKQCLSGSRRAYQQRTLRNLSSQCRIFLWIAQKIHNLHNLYLCL